MTIQYVCMFFYSVMAVFGMLFGIYCHGTYRKMCRDIQPYGLGHRIILGITIYLFLATGFFIAYAIGALTI